MDSRTLEVLAICFHPLVCVDRLPFDVSHGGVLEHTFLLVGGIGIAIDWSAWVKDTLRNREICDVPTRKARTTREVMPNLVDVTAKLVTVYGKM